jgi:hypothetical protein
MGNSTKYENALNEAYELISMCPELEITSALKQCASHFGIKDGADMGKFVKWASHEASL